MRKKILNLILGTAISFGSHSIVYAQHDHFRNSTPEERARFQTEWMKKELSLDSAIVSKVYHINLKYAKKMQDVMESDTSRMQKHANAKTISEAKDNELKKILTVEQYQLYLQKKHEMHQKMKEKAKEVRKK